MSSSKSTTSTLPTSPFHKISYDILVEIFTHCLPPEVRDNLQPRVRTAPMLLCQVCSPWRTVALSTPSLWTHISYCLAVEATEEVKKSEDFKWEVNEFDVQFLKWWKKNHRSIPPFLHLTLEMYYPGAGGFGPDGVSAIDGFDSFVLEYISSAQYLDIDESFWRHIHQAIDSGLHVAFPNLHTLMRFFSDRDEEEDVFIGSQTRIGIVPNRPPSQLRHLLIDYGEFSDNVVIPSHWSSLTHIILLGEVEISLSIWRSFIRAVPDLQWGFFDIMLSDSGNQDNDRGDIQPTMHTLHHLATLSVIFHTHDWFRNDCPIHPFFTALHLPVLHTLSLSIPPPIWQHDYAVGQLATVLQVAPNVRTLSLGHEFLAFNTIMPTAVNGIEPIWTHATHLVHLQFEFNSDVFRTVGQTKEMLDVFIQHAFVINTQWSDLTNTACPIRTITLAEERFYTFDMEDVKEFVTSSIREVKAQVAEVDLRISSEASYNEASQDMWRGWGLRP